MKERKCKICGIESLVWDWEFIKIKYKDNLGIKEKMDVAVCPNCNVLVKVDE